MLPIKWKILRVASYLHLTIVSLVTCATVYFTIDDLVRWNMDWVYAATAFLIIFIFGGVQITNTCINLYLLGNCYPDKNAKKSVYDAHVIMSIISWFFILALLGTWSWALYNFTQEYPYMSFSFRQIVAHTAVAAITLSGITMLILQPGLRKTIIRNHAKSLDDFLATES